MDHLKTVTSDHDTVHSSIELDVARSIRILHIEDDETIAAVAKEIFEGEGWQVHTCDDGNAAIEHISGAVHYDFLLFDYDLPGIDGFRACPLRTQTGPSVAHSGWRPFSYSC